MYASILEMYKLFDTEWHMLVVVISLYIYIYTIRERDIKICIVLLIVVDTHNKCIALHVIKLCMFLVEHKRKGCFLIKRIKKRKKKER